MSTNLQFINDIITDDLLDKKIRETEANIQAFENNNLEENPNNSNSKNEKKIYSIKGKDYNDNNKQGLISTNNEINEINKKVDRDKEIDIKDLNNNNYLENISLTKEKIISEYENNSSNSNKINNISINTSKINNSNSKDNDLNKIINNENKYSSEISKQKYSKNNIKKNEKRNFKKNINSKNNYVINVKDKNFLYDNIDLSLYYQYTSLLSNEKIRNVSAGKRTVHNNKKNNNKNTNIKNNKKISMNKDINEELFSSVYERFLEKDKKKKEKLQKMKKYKEEQENKKYLYKPQINKKSIELTSKNKEDFVTRQQKLMEEKKKRDNLLREKIEKQEKEEIDKNNILLSHNFSTKDENIKTIKKRRKSIDETINKLYEWEFKRKEKINNKIKIKENDIENITSNSPDINRKSYKIKVKRNSNQVINRLYKIDPKKRKEKQEMLNQLYTPSFQPIIVDKKIKIKKNKIRKKEKDNINIDKNINSHHILNKNNILVFSTDNLKTNHINNTVDELNDFDYEIHRDNLIRRRVFSKVRNKPRCNSSLRLNFVEDENSLNYINSNESIDYDNDKSIKDNKIFISSSFVHRNKKKINFN